MEMKIQIRLGAHLSAQIHSSLPHQASVMYMHACTDNSLQLKGRIDMLVLQISLYSVKSGSQYNEPW